MSTTIRIGHIILCANLTYVRMRVHTSIYTWEYVNEDVYISVGIHEDRLLVVNLSLRNHNAENAPGGLRSYLSRAKAVRKFERKVPRKPSKLPFGCLRCFII